MIKNLYITMYIQTFYKLAQRLILRQLPDKF